MTDDRVGTHALLPPANTSMRMNFNDTVSIGISSSLRFLCLHVLRRDNHFAGFHATARTVSLLRASLTLRRMRAERGLTSPVPRLDTLAPYPDSSSRSRSGYQWFMSRTALTSKYANQLKLFSRPRNATRLIRNGLQNY